MSGFFLGFMDVGSRRSGRPLIQTIATSPASLRHAAEARKRGQEKKNSGQLSLFRKRFRLKTTTKSQTDAKKYPMSLEECLQTYLKAPTPLSRAEFLRQIPISALLGALASGSELESLICEALNFIFSGEEGLHLLLQDDVFPILPLVLIFLVHPSHNVVQAFGHSNPDIRKLVLKQAGRIHDLDLLVHFRNRWMQLKLLDRILLG